MTLEADLETPSALQCCVPAMKVVLIPQNSLLSMISGFHFIFSFPFYDDFFSMTDYYFFKHQVSSREMTGNEGRT